MPPRNQAQILLESVSKGMFLGLWAELALGTPGIGALSTIVGGTLILLGAALAIGGRMSAPSTARGASARLVIAILRVLDHPRLVHAAVLVGLAAFGLWWGWPLLETLVAMALGGALGFVFHGIVGLRSKQTRRSAVALLAVCFTAAVWQSAEQGWLEPTGGSVVCSLGLLAGAFLYYLMIFAGESEETELEVGLLCLSLAAALAQLNVPPVFRGAIMLIPMGLYVVYAERVRKNLIVFKHIVRGVGYENQRALKNALRSYRRALDILPSSEMAQAGNWRIHRSIDLRGATLDSDVVELIDPLVCLDRVGKLLNDGPPTSAKGEEARHLLDIVQYRRPDLSQTIGFQRIRAYLAEDRPADALEIARRLIDVDPIETSKLPDHEMDALFRNWKLLLTNPALIGAGSLDALSDGEGLFRFLSVLTSRRRQAPNDAEADSFRPFVYDKLTAEAYERYLSLHPADPIDWLDYSYCRDVATAVAREGKHERAIELLSIAEQGLPKERMTIWQALADLHDRMAEGSGAEWRRRIKEMGSTLGPVNLPSAQQEAYFDAVKTLGESARKANALDEAIEDYELLTASPRSGVETLRILKELYESAGRKVEAVRPIEAALAYSLDSKSKAHWLAEKSRLYASITADELQPLLSRSASYFDFVYCYRRAKKLFEEKAPVEEVVRYLDLAAMGGSNQLMQVNFLLGRCRLRAGEDRAAAECLEAVRTAKPAKFVDADQEEAYFTACRLLGDLYLEGLGAPANAVECYLIYKDYLKSGAETLYRLGRAYEANGQAAHARKWYDMVLVYPSHPRAEDAKAALSRLRT